MPIVLAILGGGQAAGRGTKASSKNSSWQFPGSAPGLEQTLSESVSAVLLEVR